MEDNIVRWERKATRNCAAYAVLDLTYTSLSYSYSPIVSSCSYNCILLYTMNTGNITSHVRSLVFSLLPSTLSCGSALLMQVPQRAVPHRHLLRYDDKRVDIAMHTCINVSGRCSKPVQRLRRSSSERSSPCTAV